MPGTALSDRQKQPVANRIDSAQQAQNAHHGAYDDRQTDWTDLSRSKVPLVQARAFVMRLAKRERPITTPRWRMCPST
jgi:hypothetical protein